MIDHATTTATQKQLRVRLIQSLVRHRLNAVAIVKGSFKVKLSRQVFLKLFVICVSTLGWGGSALAQTYVSDTLKRMSYFTRVITNLETYQAQLVNQDEIQLEIGSILFDSKGSVLTAQQSHILNGTKKVQRWFIVANESTGSPYRPMKGVTLLFCETDRILLIWRYPLVLDFVDHCTIDDNVLVDDLETDTVEARYFLEDLDSAEQLTARYPLSLADRWVEFADSDVESIQASLSDAGVLRLHISGNETDTRDNVSEDVSIRVVLNLQDQIPDHEPTDPLPEEPIPFSPVFDQESDWEGPSHLEIQSILEPTYDLLTRSFGRPHIDESLKIQRHSPDGPYITLRYEEGQKVQLIALNTSQRYFQQYTYQFSHELGHLLTNWERRPGPDRRFIWFEETLAELASAFTLATYSLDPPSAMSYFSGESWEEYFDGTYFNRYGQDLQDNWNISPDTLVRDWFSLYEEDLTNNCCIRELNWAVGREMLPAFLDDPTLWEAAAFINYWDTTSDIDIYDYLESWRTTLIANKVRPSVVELLLNILPTKTGETAAYANNIARWETLQKVTLSTEFGEKTLEEKTSIGDLPGEPHRE